jgi:hypothetical protein
VIDPQQPDISGGAPRLKADAIMIVDIAVDLTNVIYVAYTSTATSAAVAASERYEIVEKTPTGIIPGGTHWACDLRRFR